MRWFLLIAAALHLLFMAAELFPWSSPALLSGLVAKKLKSSDRFSESQQTFVATLVHNVGIYNAIVGGGLLWAAIDYDAHTDVAKVMLAGAALAGAFGTATLKSWGTALQAAIGVAGLLLLRS